MKDVHKDVFSDEDHEMIYLETGIHIKDSMGTV
jgi:hypothetical protein